jgi:hypothetical protein
MANGEWRTGHKLSASSLFAAPWSLFAGVALPQKKKVAETATF